jgi:hypothetical protein
MIAQRPSDGTVLALPRLPARLDVQQTAKVLGFMPHDIPVLIRAKLLRPLGNPVQNAPKYFAACVVEELARNPEWLDKATKAVSDYWRRKNQMRIAESPA